jgi:hypothetical protein
MARESTSPMVCASGPGVTPHLSGRRLAGPDFVQGVQDVGLVHQAAAAPRDLPPGPQHEHGGGAAHVQQADQVHPLARVYLHVPDAVSVAGHFGQDPAGGTARSTELRGKLQQGGPGAERLAQLGCAEPDSATGSPRAGQPAIAAPPGHPERRRPGQDDQACDKSAYHGLYSATTARAIPGYAPAAMTFTRTLPCEMISKLRTLSWATGDELAYHTVLSS